MRDSRYDIYIFGEVLFDIINKNKILGGAPFNVAWNLKMLGLNPAFISAIGDDELGEVIEKRFNTIDLENIFLQKKEGKRSGVVNVEFLDSSPSYKIEEDVAYDYIDAPKECENIELLYLGSLALRNEHSKNSALNLKKRAKRVFVDINLRYPHYTKETIKELLENINYLKINSDELEILKDIYPFTTSQKLYDILGLDMLIVTCAKDGSYLLDGVAKIEQKAFEVLDFKDSVGAGDAFASAFIEALLSGKDSKEILKRASLFASKICSIKGATSEKLAIYSEILEELKE